jgi:hypothetical protein
MLTTSFILAPLPTSFR